MQSVIEDLTIATNAKTPLPGGNGVSIDELASQVELVAGRGFEPLTFRL
jgi:hypothetical protein